MNVFDELHCLLQKSRNKISAMQGEPDPCWAEQRSPIRQRTKPLTCNCCPRAQLGDREQAESSMGCQGRTPCTPSPGPCCQNPKTPWIGKPGLSGTACTSTRTALTPWCSPLSTDRCQAGMFPVPLHTLVTPRKGPSLQSSPNLSAWEKGPETFAAIHNSLGGSDQMQLNHCRVKRKRSTRI